MEPLPFVLSAVTSVESSITDVRVDGSSIDLAVDASGRLARIERSYDDYLTAQEAPVVVLEFYALGSLRYSGIVRAGACARSCSDLLCSQGNDLRAEELVLPSGRGFAPYEYICMRCLGEEHDVTSCP